MIIDSSGVFGPQPGQLGRFVGVQRRRRIGSGPLERDPPAQQGPDLLGGLDDRPAGVTRCAASRR